MFEHSYHALPRSVWPYEKRQNVESTRTNQEIKGLEANTIRPVSFLNSAMLISTAGRGIPDGTLQLPEVK